MRRSLLRSPSRPSAAQTSTQLIARLAHEGSISHRDQKSHKPREAKPFYAAVDAVNDHFGSMLDLVDASSQALWFGRHF